MSKRIKNILDINSYVRNMIVYNKTYICKEDLQLNFMNIK